MKKRTFACALLMGLQSLRAADAPQPIGGQVQLRGSLTNFRIQFEHTQTGRVALMGGSITEMEGFRPMVCESLKKRFPVTDFEFVNAGIASTCSTTGAFRLGLRAKCLAVGASVGSAPAAAQEVWRQGQPRAAGRKASERGKRHASKTPNQCFHRN